MVPRKTTPEIRNSFLEKYNKRLTERHLKSTTQRDVIIKTFLDMKRHVSLEDLYQEVQKTNPNISFVTVYRTLKLLVQMCLVVERKFHEGTTRFEFVSEKDHHDHLICLKCGRIVEFENLDIEMLQEEVAQKHKFFIVDHKMELYGHCAKCRTKEKAGTV